ncbi:MAG: sortase [bacterium]|nr:sortase [bacterium]
MKVLQEFATMFFVHEDRHRYRKIFLIRTIGNTLIIGSLVFVLSQFYPVLAAEVGYRWERATTDRNVEEAQIPENIRIPATATNSAEVTPKPLPALTDEPVNQDFGIVIDKIHANSAIISDVDPFNANEYDAALKRGVAHAKETRYPGETGNVYLFAHNTLNAWDIRNYNAVFYLLHNLDAGDRISTFYKKERFDYIVFDKQIHSAKNLAPLETQYSEPVLSLQTCWPPGTTWQRLIVRAKLDR